MTSFRTFLLAIVSLVSAGSALGSTWTLSDVKVTTLCGVSAISTTEVFAAMADNTLGPGVLHSTDAAKTTEYIGPAGGMNMDIAFTPVGTVGIMASLGGLLLTQDGKTFSKVPGIEAVSQNVEAFSSASLGATGGFVDKSTRKHYNGVAVSTNYGSTWNLFDIGLNSSYIARYGAFPTNDVWYVSSGSWPASEAKVEGAYKLSSRVHLFEKGQGRVAEFPTAPAAVTGYPGAISKTTDAGKTWTKVYDSNGSMYFNEINCFDADHCMAVAENSGEFSMSSYTRTLPGCTDRFFVH